MCHVAAAVPAIMSSGRGEIRSMNVNGAKAAMRSMLFGRDQAAARGDGRG
jgi:hypothetical protein